MPRVAKLKPEKPAPKSSTPKKIEASVVVALSGRDLLPLADDREETLLAWAERMKQRHAGKTLSRDALARAALWLLRERDRSSDPDLARLERVFTPVAPALAPTKEPIVDPNRWRGGETAPAPVEHGDPFDEPTPEPVEMDFDDEEDDL